MVQSWTQDIPDEFLFEFIVDGGDLHFSGFSPKEFIYESLSDGDPNFFPLDKKG
ncbi:MAG: hypothetical protein AAGH81_02085 [Bacteroidota bacterium]